MADKLPTKTQYALKAMEIANSNHIRVNAMCAKDTKFFYDLGKMVYDKLNWWETTDIISFGENSNLKIPWSITFISINQS